MLTWIRRLCPSLARAIRTRATAKQDEDWHLPTFSLFFWGIVYMYFKFKLARQNTNKGDMIFVCFLQMRKTCSSCCDERLDVDDGGRSTFSTRSAQLSTTGSSRRSAAVCDELSFWLCVNEGERREKVLLARSVVWTNDWTVDEDIEAVSSMTTSSRLIMELSRCLLANRRKT